MNIQNRLLCLRAEMAKNNIQAVLIPGTDPHQSEYVADHWLEREWISGFNGSAGTVVVTEDHAGLWTDSRYFIQAELQLQNSEFVLHKMYNQFEPSYIDFTIQNLKEGDTLGVNGFMISQTFSEYISEKCRQKGIHLKTSIDLIQTIWTDRPPLPLTPIIHHDVQFCGQKVGDKIKNIVNSMDQHSVDYHLITALDEIAWTLNIRGNDVTYNPVAVAYLLVGRLKTHLFILEDKLTDESKMYFKKLKIEVHDYNDIIPFLNTLDPKKRILVDSQICSHSLFNAINGTIVKGASIPKWLKAIKNNTEIKQVQKAMEKDGAALAHTFYWLEKSLDSNESIEECDVADKLAYFRSQQAHYYGESFSAIIGYGSNGAIIHYKPERETNKTIQPTGILLVDSGGQYLDGTTDITRTFSLGDTTTEQKKHYTLILKGMIQLSLAVFPEGTSGAQLDTLARQFLWAEGLNYLHGTGHGVGFFLNVHEPPQGFAAINSERGRTPQKIGMITSNEPGFYLEGAYGMRIENLILCIPSGKEGFLAFKTLTLYPFDHKLIEKSLLSKNEIKWINTYHKMVFKKVGPYLDNEVKNWFKNKCRNI